MIDIEKYSKHPPWRLIDLLAVIILVNITVLFLFKGLENPIVIFLQTYQISHAKLVFILLGTLIQASLLAGLVFFFAYKRGGTIKDLGLATDNIGRNVLIGIAGGFMLLFMIIIVSIFINIIAFYLGIPQKPQMIVEILQQIKSREGLVIAILMGSFLAPISEELYFRGFTYPLLKAHWGPWPAMLVTSLIFATLHFDWFRLIPLTLGGLGLNLLYERTGSLFTSIVAHSVWNTTMTLLVFAIPQTIIS